MNTASIDLSSELQKELETLEGRLKTAQEVRLKLRYPHCYPQVLTGKSSFDLVGLAFGTAALHSRLLEQTILPLQSLPPAYLCCRTCNNLSC